MGIITALHKGVVTNDQGNTVYHDQACLVRHKIIKQLTSCSSPVPLLLIRGKFPPASSMKTCTNHALVCYRCCDKLPQASWWLNTHTDYLTVLGVRSLKWVSRAVFLLEALGETVSSLSLASRGCLNSLRPILHLQSQQRSIFRPLSIPLLL